MAHRTAMSHPMKCLLNSNSFFSGSYYTLEAEKENEEDSFKESPSNAPSREIPSRNLSHLYSEN